MFAAAEWWLPCILTKCWLTSSDIKASLAVSVSFVPMDRPPVCDGKRDGSVLCNFFELLRMFLQKEYTNTVLTNLTSTNSSNTALIKSSANLCLRFIEVWGVSSLHIGLGYHSDGYCFLCMLTCLHCENFWKFYHIPVLNIKQIKQFKKYISENYY